jgi:hypothetical protein
MLNRLLATIPGKRVYLDVGSDHPATDLRYWQEMAELNLAIFRREGVSLQDYRNTAPIIQDLANVLAKARRAGA